MATPQAILPTGGATAFQPSLGDFVLEAFGRIQVRAPSLTAEHWWHARMSSNLLLSEWVNVGMPLLFKINLLQIPLIPGQVNYTLPSTVIAPLDAFISTFTLGPGVSFPSGASNIFILGQGGSLLGSSDVLGSTGSAFVAPSAGSQSMTINLANHGLAIGQMVYFPVPIAASGGIIQGVYLVTSVVDVNNFEITLSYPADGTNAFGGPVISATAKSNIFTVTLPYNGLSIGQQFYINIPTSGPDGTLLQGGFYVNSIVDPSNFTIIGSQTATQSWSMSMNSGNAMIQTQATGVDVIDYILYPISRTEYAAQPDKNLQFRPTTFWFQRLRQPVVTFWNEPDNQPCLFNIWCMTQPEDSVLDGGVGPDIIYRFYEAYASGLAAKLARKYPPPLPNTIGDLKLEAQAALTAALAEDIERVPVFIQPGTSSYWRT